MTATYREMLDRAQTARQVADATASDLVELACAAPREQAVARIAARHDLSDVTAATLAAMATDFDRWPEAAAVDTSGALGESLAGALAAAGEPPVGGGLQPSDPGTAGPTAPARPRLA